MCIWVHEIPRWLSDKESTCWCRRHKLDPWVKKILWRRKWQHTPVFLPGKMQWTEEPGGLQLVGVTKSWTQLSIHTHTHIHTHTQAYIYIFFFIMWKFFLCIYIFWMKEKGTYHKDKIYMANSILGSPQTLSHSTFRQYHQTSEQIVVSSG